MAKNQTMTEKYRVIRYLLNVGELTAVEAVKKDIAANLRSRVVDLRDMGFSIKSEKAKDKNHHYYYVPSDELEKNRQKFREVFYG